MNAYFANLVGLGFNFVGTFLLLKYSPESKTADGWTITGNVEKIPTLMRLSRGWTDPTVA
jgi:hypothetical protein